MGIVGALTIVVLFAMSLPAAYAILAANETLAKDLGKKLDDLG